MKYFIEWKEVIESRLVLSGNTETIKQWKDVFDQVARDGYGACIIEVEGEGENSEIKIRQVPRDRFYINDQRTM